MKPTERQEITAGQVARLLGISRQTVINRVNAGTLIPAGRTPEGIYIFLRRDIEEKRDAELRQSSSKAEEEETSSGRRVLHRTALPVRRENPDVDSGG